MATYVVRTRIVEHFPNHKVVPQRDIGMISSAMHTAVRRIFEQVNRIGQSVRDATSELFRPRRSLVGGQEIQTPSQSMVAGATPDRTTPGPSRARGHRNFESLNLSSP